MRLMYFRKLSEEGEGIVKRVFDESRERADRGDKRGWGWYTKQLMLDLGFGKEWQTGKVGSEQGRWRTRVWQAIQTRETMKWRRTMIGKTTLTRYMRIKNRLRRETFLKRHRTGVRRLIRLRAGVERLHMVRGRYRGTKTEDRKCLVCCSGEVETETHVIEECVGVYDERCDMWKKIRMLMHDRMMMRRVDMME